MIHKGFFASIIIARNLFLENPMENNNINEVNIVDIKMPFWSMVIFMVKAAIASIPAFIILAIIFTVLNLILGGLFSGMGRY